MGDFFLARRLFLLGRFFEVVPCLSRPLLTGYVHTPYSPLPHSIG